MRALVTAASAAAVTATAHTLLNLRALRTPEVVPAGAVTERVSVLLPLRDEVARVGPCLLALLRQEGVPDLELLVLDDGSTDGTAALVRQLAGDDPRVRVIEGGADPLPPGWLGKPWACARLAGAASGSVLVLVDADVVLAPHAVAATVRLLRSSGLDLLSPYPRQLAGTPAERLVQPLLQWSWLTTLPLRVAERSARPSLAAANGQLLAVDAAAYRRAGGHEAVRGEVLDDVALLRAVKRSGGRGAVIDGTLLATCRMYDGWADLRRGYEKSLWAAFGSTPAAVAVATALVVVYVVPPAAVLAAPVAGLGGRTAAAGAIGYAAGVAGRAAVARRMGGRAWPDSLAHPVSIAAFALLVARSLRGHRAGTLTWKGRALP